MYSRHDTVHIVIQNHQVNTVFVSSGYNALILVLRDITEQ